MEPSHERFMAGQAEPDLARRVVLANTPALSLGDLHVEPSLRRVANADGREEIVEPRVMQVLVALIQADGRILARDELLTRCWHGVVVGDDAINRVIGRLRRLADGIGGGAFKLETITKVGFRLVESRSHGPSYSLTPDIAGRGDSKRRQRSTGSPFCRSRT